MRPSELPVDLVCTLTLMDSLHYGERMKSAEQHKHRLEAEYLLTPNAPVQYYRPQTWRSLYLSAPACSYTFRSLGRPPHR